MKRKRINVYLDNEAYIKFKHLCVDEEVSISSKLNEVIYKALKELEEKKNV